MNKQSGWRTRPASLLYYQVSLHLHTPNIRKARRGKHEVRSGNPKIGWWCCGLWSQSQDQRRNSRLLVGWIRNKEWGIMKKEEGTKIKIGVDSKDRLVMLWIVKSLSELQTQLKAVGWVCHCMWEKPWTATEITAWTRGGGCTDMIFVKSFTRPEFSGPKFYTNIARIANVVQCHSLLSGNRDCHEFRVSIVRIVFSVSNVTCH